MGFKTINGKKVFIDDNRRTSSTNGRNDQSEGMKIGSGTRVPKIELASNVKEIGDDSADERIFDVENVKASPEIDEKVIESDLIVRTINMLEVVGDSRFKDEPYVAELLLVPRNESFPKSKLEEIANQAGIESDEVDTFDKIIFGAGLRLGEEIQGKDPIGLVNELAKEAPARAGLIGFFLDRPVNQIGDTGFDRLEELVSVK